MPTWTEESWTGTSWGLDSWESRTGKKFLYMASNGYIHEQSSVSISDGPPREGCLVSLNSDGVLDLSILNAKTTSDGSEDSGKIPVLNAFGRLSTSFIPDDIIADTYLMMAAENLGSGSIINIFDDNGVSKCRKASASFPDRGAHGYVLSSCLQGENALIYFEGNNNQVTGLTPGTLFLSTTAGLATSNPPTGSGKIVQRIGFATSTSSINFQSLTPVLLE